MLVNIEREYEDFICECWLKLSETTKDISKFRERQNRTYRIISLQSIRFLRAKLKMLENKGI